LLLEEYARQRNAEAVIRTTEALQGLSQRGIFSFGVIYHGMKLLMSRDIGQLPLAAD